ncbi:MAG TPA: ATP-dependent Clp protease adaptor ClpS [bacterium]
MEIGAVPVKEKTTTEKPKVVRPWQVILYNDDIHAIDEVILQVQKATRCSLVEATRITVEAHFKGKAVAFSGEFSECHRVAGVLREIGLLVEIQG